MSQLATQTVISHFNNTVVGAIGYLFLNYDEFKCLDVARQFLTGQLNQSNQHPCFAGLSQYRLDYIDDWLHDPKLKSQLRFDGKNKVRWAVIDEAVVNWLALALEVGFSEDAIITMAADEAHYECDMAAMYGDDSNFNSHYRAFYQYYCRIAKLRYPLLRKLRAIQQPFGI